MSEFTCSGGGKTVDRWFARDLNPEDPGPFERHEKVTCPDCGREVRIARSITNDRETGTQYVAWLAPHNSIDIPRIIEREELVKLASELGVRSDWHEPDEVGVTAKTSGTSFDNAGFWPADPSRETVEQHVILYQADKPVAAVNLAMLFAWATEK